MTYAERLRALLTGRKRAGWDYERAWRYALERAGTPYDEHGWMDRNDIAPHVLDFAKRAFCDGYHGRNPMGVRGMLDLTSPPVDDGARAINAVAGIAVR